MLIAFLKSTFMKDTLGELQVNLVAYFFLDKRIYTLFKHVTLRTEGGTTQINHVIVSRYGDFVIETKNLAGWSQNYKHTQFLPTVLQIDPEKIFSVVVFVGGSSFKTTMPDNVVNAGGYIRLTRAKGKSF